MHCFLELCSTFRFFGLRCWSGRPLLNASRKQFESSSQVVQKSFGNASYFCRTQLLPICKQKRFGGLLCYWPSPHILDILCACTQMFACHKQQYMAGCSREDSSGLPWSRSARETGTVGRWANDIFKDISAHMHVWMCVHTQLYVSPYGDGKPLPCCGFNFSINTVYKHCLRQQFPFMFIYIFLWTICLQIRTIFMRVPYLKSYDINHCVDKQKHNKPCFSRVSFEIVFVGCLLCLFVLFLVDTVCVCKLYLCLEPL